MVPSSAVRDLSGRVYKSRVTSPLRPPCSQACEELASVHVVSHVQSCLLLRQYLEGPHSLSAMTV